VRAGEGGALATTRRLHVVVDIDPAGDHWPTDVADCIGSLTNRR
jgi:hypothetical protein